MEYEERNGVTKTKDLNEEYHSSEYLGKSKLSRILTSPYHFKYFLDNPPPSTPALVIGSAFHKLVLENEDFNKEFVVMSEDFNLRTKSAKEQVAEWGKKGITPIKYSDFQTINAMRDSLLQTKFSYEELGIKSVEQLFDKEKEVETSYYWTDEQTGVKVSCRPDLRRNTDAEFDLVCDLKSCVSANTTEFMKSALSFHYDMQSAQYCDGLWKYYQKPHKFIFLAVEKTPPYATNILLADDLFMQRGYDLYRECLGKVKECRETDNYFGYNGSEGGVNMLGLPAYLAEQIQRSD